jgi:hypothetical protein
MNKNLDLIAKELYAKISSYPNLLMKDAENNDVEEDEVEGARAFSFDYEVGGHNLATITIHLNDNDEDQDSFEVLISNDPTEGKVEHVKKLFLAFVKEMREFAKQHILTFDVHVITRSNKERDIGESIMSESKLFGTAKTSYQRIGEATLIIKHRDVVNQQNPAGRAQRIESIYVENADGERFKYPHRHLNGARALAQHVSHGGNLYDSIGQYMVGLSEELSQLRMFKNYVERNDAISEAMGGVHAKVLERIAKVKKDIQHLQRPAAYKEFAEGFTEQHAVDIPEEIMNDWIDRLTVRTFNEDLKGVFPYIFRLVSEDDIPVKELDADDLLSEGDPEEDTGTDSFSTVIPEFAEYESYLHSIVESSDTGIFSEDNAAAIEELNQLMATPLLLGVDGTNITQSLEGLGFDKGFVDGLKKIAKEKAGEGMDARPFIKEYIEQKDSLLGTDVLSQLKYEEGETEVPSETPAGEEPSETPAGEMPEIPPVEEPGGMGEIPGGMGGMPGGMGGMPGEEPGGMGEIPGEEPSEMPTGEEPGGMGGMPGEEPSEMPTGEEPGEETGETPKVTAPGPVAEAIAKESRSRLFDELREFIHSMYNEDAGNFPKGIEGVKIACEKKFGDRVGPMAAKIVERMTSIGEMHRMKKLSGVKEESEKSVPNEKLIKTRIRQIQYDRKLSGTDSKAGELAKLKQQLQDLKNKSTEKTSESSELSAILRIAGLK